MYRHAQHNSHRQNKVLLHVCILQLIGSRDIGGTIQKYTCFYYQASYYQKLSLVIMCDNNIYIVSFYCFSQSHHNDSVSATKCLPGNYLLRLIMN